MNKINPGLLILILITLLVFLAKLASGQTIAPGAPTNALIWPSAPVVPASNCWATVVADDVRKLVFDLISGFSLGGIIQAIVLAYLGAKGLRNFTTLGAAGRIGQLLRLLTLEAAANSPTPLAPATGDPKISPGTTPTENKQTTNPN
jgi:hypothetical protein